MKVGVAAVGLLCPAGIGPEGAWGGREGEVPGFRAAAYVQNRKNLKLMARSVKLGVSAIQVALTQVEGWESVPPERRGMFVGTTPLGGELADLVPALDVSTDADGELDISLFGTEGYGLIHPLWLVKGLSNNVLGFASAIHDFQGTNANYCDGESSGGTALHEGWCALVEGRAELIVAGGADSWVELDALIGGRRGGEGAAFFVLREARDGDLWTLEASEGPTPPDEQKELGYLGAAGEVVALARRLYRGEEPGFLSPSGGPMRFRRTPWSPPAV